MRYSLRECEIDMRYFIDEPLTNDGLLVGRERECNFVSVLEKGNLGNLLFTASKGYGKTTMLLWTKRLYERRKSVIAYLSNGNFIRDGSTMYRIMTTYLSEWVLKHGERFSKKTIDYFERLNRFLKTAPADSKDGFYLSNVFSQSLDILEDDGLEFPIFYFIDDLDTLGMRENYNLRGIIRPFFSNEKRVRWYITMSPLAITKTKMIDEAVLDRFISLPIPALTKEQTKEMIRKRLEVARGGCEGIDEWYPFTEDAIDYIAEESHGVPRDALTITSMSISYGVSASKGGDKEKIDVGILEEYFKNLKMDTTSRVILGISIPIEKEIAKAIDEAGGCATLKYIAEKTSETKSNLAYHLSQMMGEGLIFKERRGVYCLTLRYKK